MVITKTGSTNIPKPLQPFGIQVHRRVVEIIDRRRKRLYPVVCHEPEGEQFRDQKQAVGQKQPGRKVDKKACHCRRRDRQPRALPAVYHKRRAAGHVRDRHTKIELAQRDKELGVDRFGQQHIQAAVLHRERQRPKIGVHAHVQPGQGDVSADAHQHFTGGKPVDRAAGLQDQQRIHEFDQHIPAFHRDAGHPVHAVSHLLHQGIFGKQPQQPQVMPQAQQVSFHLAAPFQPPTAVYRRRPRRHSTAHSSPNTAIQQACTASPRPMAGKVSRPLTMLTQNWVV